MNDTDAEFSTTCPSCHVTDQLEVVSGTFSTIGMRLESDGFSFCDARQCDTDEVTVQCLACQVRFPLSQVM